MQEAPFGILRSHKTNDYLVPRFTDGTGNDPGIPVITRRPESNLRIYFNEKRKSGDEKGPPEHPQLSPPPGGYSVDSHPDSQRNSLDLFLKISVVSQTGIFPEINREILNLLILVRDLNPDHGFVSDGPTIMP